MKLKDLNRWDKFKLIDNTSTTYKFYCLDRFDPVFNEDIYYCYDMLTGQRVRFCGSLDVILPPFRKVNDLN